MERCRKDVVKICGGKAKMRRETIYLSPSKQPENRYAAGNTNEEKEMVAVAKLLKKILEEDYGLAVVLANLSLDISQRGRPKEAKDKGCSLYIALHSNAGGGGKASGAVALYHPKSPKSLALSKILVEELDGICPYKSNRARNLVNGMESFNGIGFAEVRSPFNLGLTPVLMETNFHDHKDIALWIIGHKEDIAKAYARAIARFLEVDQKAQEVEPIQESPKEEGLYRVQVGAFRKRENAETLVQKLWQQGFEGFIRYS